MTYGEVSEELSRLAAEIVSFKNKSEEMCADDAIFSRIDDVLNRVLQDDCKLNCSEEDLAEYNEENNEEDNEIPF